MGFSGTLDLSRALKERCRGFVGNEARVLVICRLQGYLVRNLAETLDQGPLLDIGAGALQGLCGEQGPCRWGWGMQQGCSREERT